MSKTAQSPRHTFADLPPAARAALDDMSLAIDELRVYEFAVRGMADSEIGVKEAAQATAERLLDLHTRLSTQWHQATGAEEGGGR